MIHINELEIKMIQGKMAESLFELNETFGWLTRLMLVDDFQTKYSIADFAKNFMKRVDDLDDYITSACHNVDDPELKMEIDCQRCSEGYDALNKKYVNLLVKTTLAAKDKK